MNPIPHGGTIPTMPVFLNGYLELVLVLTIASLFVMFGMLLWNIRDAVREVPLDRILIETDCPYLAPVPMRGKRNEPAYVVHTAAAVAKEAGLSVEDLAARTTANACAVFGLT